MTATEEDDPIPAGSVWREAGTGRLVRVTGSRDADVMVYWHYVGAGGAPEPHGPAHPGWWVHHSDCFDFVVWGRFARVS